MTPEAIAAKSRRPQAIELFNHLPVVIVWWPEVVGALEWGQRRSYSLHWPHRHGVGAVSSQILTFATVTGSTIKVLTKAFHSDTIKVIDCVTVKSFC